MKIEGVCRTCLTDEGTFMNIQSIINNNTISQMITDLTNLQILPSDGFTQLICSVCVNETQNAHKFQRKCLESSEVLLEQNKDNVLSALENFNNDSLPETCKSELTYSEDVEIKNEADEKLKDDEEDIKMEIKNVSSHSDDGYPIIASACDDKKEEHSEESNNLLIKDIFYNNDRVKTNRKFSLDPKDKNSKIMFACPLCNALFTSDKVFDRHIYEFHDDRTDDPKFSEEMKILGFITKGKKNSKHSYKCATDDFVGNSITEFRNHLKEHYGEKPIMCTNCDYKTGEISLLKLHKIQMHSETKLFSCSECNYQCKRSGQLLAHSACHTTERRFKCKLCPMTFKQSPALSEHKKLKHGGKKDFVCSFCNKAFIKSERLKNHLRMHTGEKPHVCHVCGIGFSQKPNLQTHIQKKHETEKPVMKCEHCNYTAKHKTNLAAHMKRHQPKVKNLQCLQCPFITAIPYSLKTHIMRRHNGEKNFKCDVCDYRCFTKKCLQIHNRIHTGEKPYECNMCSYRCKSLSALSSHRESHIPDLVFPCPNCPFVANCRSVLRKHVRNQCIIKKRGRPFSRTVPKSIEPSDCQTDGENDENVH